jgi:hypothetical protein
VLSAGVMYDESPERGGAAGAETTETSRGEGRLRLPRPATSSLGGAGATPARASRRNVAEMRRP